MMGTHNRTAVVVWSPVLIVAATGVAWSLAPMLTARESAAIATPEYLKQPDATSVARKADLDAPLARKGDYVIPLDLAARWVPLAPAVKVEGGPTNEPSIERPSPPPDPPSSAARKPVRTEATPHHRAPARAEARSHHRARVHQNPDLCAAQGMRREDTYQDNHWRSWRCVS